MIPALRTPRLNLQPCTLEDVDALEALWCDPQVREYLWDNEIITRGQAEEVVRTSMAASRQRGLGLWIIRRLEDGRTIGCCALRPLPPEDTLPAGSTTPRDNEVELIYALAPADWGQGLASEASRAVMEYGFATLELARIWALMDPQNLASQRVAARLGMHSGPGPSHARGVLLSYVVERAQFSAIP